MTAADRPLSNSQSHKRTNPPSRKTSATVRRSVSPIAIAVLVALASTLYMTSLLSRLSRAFASSSSMAAQPATVPAGAQLATVAAGCFWGVEHAFRAAFANKGLYDARVGYIGGDTNNPSYRAVCSGTTGHAEATQLVFDPEKVSYRTLLEFFYKMHDPTTLNQQGNDRGTQYRSGIFFHDAEQEKIAKDVTEKVNAQWWGGKVKTEILPAKQWWDAEEYHQLYLDKNPFGYQCPSHHVRNFPELK
jgi:peptide-methionine (S)-S-oxide reductase